MNSIEHEYKTNAIFLPFIDSCSRIIKSKKTVLLLELSLEAGRNVTIFENTIYFFVWWAKQSVIFSRGE